MLAFLGACFLLIATPGPGVLTTAGVGSGFGFRPGVSYVAGLWAGNNLVAFIVVSGIAAAVLAVTEIRIFLTLLSAAYLLYLGIKIALSGSRIAFMERQREPGLLDGVFLQLVNPKAYAVTTTLFSGFAFHPDNLLTETIIKFAIMNAIWIPVHLAWLAAGVTLHRLDLAPRVHRTINVFMAVSMLIVVGLATHSALGEFYLP